MAPNTKRKVADYSWLGDKLKGLKVYLAGPVAEYKHDGIVFDIQGNIDRHLAAAKAMRESGVEIVSLVEWGYEKYGLNDSEAARQDILLRNATVLSSAPHGSFMVAVRRHDGTLSRGVVAEIDAFPWKNRIIYVGHHFGKEVEP